MIALFTFLGMAVAGIFAAFLAVIVVACLISGIYHLFIE